MPDNILQSHILNPRGGNPPGIGVLNEKPVHKLLKSYLEPDVSRHEVRLEGYIVDVLRDDGIFEIQSRHFYKIKDKLIKLLDNHKVTVVYPVVRTKWINWVDRETGEILRRRKSPKTGRPCHILTELYGIRNLLAHENLSFAVVRLDAEDYRLAATTSRRQGKGCDRLECIPLTWLDISYFGGTCRRGLGQVLPELAEEFTSLEFGRAGAISQKHVHGAMKVLSEAGIIMPIGKQGRRNLYRKA